MEPLLDKLARQKAVRMIFETIRYCDKQSDKLPNIRAMLERHRVVRFVLVALFASFLVLVLDYAIIFLEYGVFEFPDIDLPPYPTPTVLQRAFDAMFYIINLPMAVLGFICDKLGILGIKSPPDWLFYVLSIAQGFFWAFAIELFIRVRRQRVA